MSPGVGLLELDVSCLRDVLCNCKHHELLALLQTCKALRDFVLSHPPAGGSAQLRLVLAEQHLQHNASCLALAQRVCPGLCLTLESHGDRETADMQVLALLVEASSKGFGQPVKGSAPLTVVKELTLRRCTLDHMVPDFLVTLCPSLTTLRLSEVVLEDLNATQPVLHPQLSTLHLDRITATAAGQGALGQAVGAQMRSLPQLQHLSITDPHVMDAADDDAWDLWLSQASSVAHQLVSLKLMGQGLEHYQSWHGPGTRPWMAVFPEGTVWPKLRQLEAALHLADNEDIHRLLQAAPVVADVSVLGMFPDSCMTNVPCSWVKLSLRDVSAEHLAWLPIANVQQLLMTGENIWLANTGEPELDMNLTVSATSAISACGGLHSASKTQSTVQVWCSAAHSPKLRLTALPMLLNLDFTTLRLVGATPLTRTCMTVVGYKTSINCLGFVDCGWEPDLLCDLVEILPCVEKFEFCRSIPSLSNVLTCIQTSSRPITLQLVKLDLDRCAADWQEQLQAAVASTKGRVTVELLEDYTSAPARS